MNVARATAKVARTSFAPLSGGGASCVEEFILLPVRSREQAGNIYLTCQLNG
jgi:hypothetical protein